MTETTLNQFVSSGTNAERVAYTPVLATPASGNHPSVIFTETDTGNTYMWNFGGSAWVQVNNAGGAVTTTGTPASGNLAKFSGAASITNGDLTGDVTTSGTLATTLANNAVSTAKIANSAVTLAKIANAVASSKLLGSGASGSGSPFAEITLGTGLSMSGTTLNASVSTATITAPQGRLTLTSNTPIMTADATAQTSVYYTPYVGDVIPIYDGAAWGNQTFAQLTMALDTTNQLLNNVYDLFVWNNSSVISIGAGPAWVTSATITVTIATPAVVSWTAHGLAEGAPVVFTTTGALPTGITAGTTYFVGRSPGTNSFNISTSVANAAAGTFVATSGTQSGTHTGANHTTLRGTGAGTSELQQLNGVWTNKNAITLTNGAGAGTTGIAANTATYVGSIYCTANGQTGMAFKPAAAVGGAGNFLALWNAYNRVRIIATSQDSTASWTYASTTWHAMNSSTLNRISHIDGLGQSFVDTSVYAVSSAGYANIGVSRDSTTAAPPANVQLGSSVTALGESSVPDGYPPALGLHFFQAMECAAAGTANFLGASTGPTRQSNGLAVRLEM